MKDGAFHGFPTRTVYIAGGLAASEGTWAVLSKLSLSVKSVLTLA